MPNSHTIERARLVAYLDQLLRIDESDDDSKNGLQVEGAERISKIAFAVDACGAAFQRSASGQAQMLIVHHGTFWSKVLVLTGVHYRRMKTLLDAQVNLYAAHLPLDLHPQLGNNAQLAQLLGLKDVRPFGKYHKQLIGVRGHLPRPVPLKQLVHRLQQGTGSPVVRVLDFGVARVRTVACISGGAADMLDQAHAAGCDVYVTGETRHGSFHEAQERKLNVIFGGHYATEVLGLKALAAHLRRKFGVQTEFIDLPTGL